MMKAFSKLVIFCMLIGLIAGCAAPAAPQPTQPPAAETSAVEPTQPPAAAETVAPVVTEAPAPTEAPTAEPVLSEKETWLKTNQLGKYDTGTQDWAAIEEAAKKEGKLVVYANSSKVTKAADLFMEMYPDIKVEAFDLGGDDVLLKTTEEQKASAFTGDVWFSSGGPEISGNLIPKEYVWRFVPDSLVSVVPDELTHPLLTSRFGLRILAYNKELNKSCPVSNLWELTNPEWKGKVFIEDPLNDASTLGILTTIASHADEMAAAYKELYGTDPVLDSDTPDAGWLWLKKFAQNGPVPEPGGDEVDSAFATPGMKDSYVAFTSYSNYPDVLDGNLAFEPCWDAKPVSAVQTQNYLGILNQAPHPNAAKLWLRFILNEGAKPWSGIGNYSPRSDVTVVEGALPFDKVRSLSWSFNDQYVFDNIIQARDFYLLNLGQP
jgi:iron(III) transport system substrate-binding protein